MLSGSSILGNMDSLFVILTPGFNCPQVATFSNDCPMPDSAAPMSLHSAAILFGIIGEYKIAIARKDSQTV